MFRPDPNSKKIHRSGFDTLAALFLFLILFTVKCLWARQDEASGPEAVLPHHGRDHQEDRHPHQADHGPRGEH